MEKLIQAITWYEGIANATAFQELLTTCKASYIERKSEFGGVNFRLTVAVNDDDLDGVFYTIDGKISEDNDGTWRMLLDCEYTFHNGNYEEYMGEGKLNYEALQDCIEEIVNF